LVVALAGVVASAAVLQRSHAYMVHLQRGAALLQNNKPAEATPELETAVRLRPGFIPARFELARAYGEQSQWNATESQLSSILQIQPRNEDAYAMLAWAYQKEGKADQARTTLEKLLQLNPQSSAAHFGLGDLAFDSRDYASALKEFQIAAEFDPRTEGVFYNMGLCQAKLGNMDGAIEAFQQEIRVSGETSDTEAALARAYRAKGMTKEAEAAEQKVSKKKPD
jgi:Tfp pilus assembly protein PilF